MKININFFNLYKMKILKILYFFLIALPVCLLLLLIIKLAPNKKPPTFK